MSTFSVGRILSEIALLRETNAISEAAASSLIAVTVANRPCTVSVVMELLAAHADREKDQMADDNPQLDPDTVHLHQRIDALHGRIREVNALVDLQARQGRMPLATGLQVVGLGLLASEVVQLLLESRRTI